MKFLRDIENFESKTWTRVNFTVVDPMVMAQAVMLKSRAWV